ncbi:hypothetical protein Q5752_003883 [Cryptotrichosporon argae]
MSLSVGTLNLKFMQRAAQRSAQPAPPPLPKAVDVAEEAAKWVLPRASTSRTAARSSPSAALGIKDEDEGNAGTGAGRAGPSVVVESSWAPFVGAAGRMVFGDYGKDEAEGANGAGEEDGDEVDEDEVADEASSGARRKGKQRADETPIERAASPDRAAFRRPAGFSPPPTSSSAALTTDSTLPSDASQAGAKRSTSTADKLRATIGAMRSVSVSVSAPSSVDSGSAAAAAPGGESKKRPAAGGAEAGKRARVDAAPAARAGKGKNGKGKGAGADSLDERERRIKADRKAEKKRLKQAAGA